MGEKATRSTSVSSKEDRLEEGEQRSKVSLIARLKLDGESSAQSDPQLERSMTQNQASQGIGSCASSEQETQRFAPKRRARNALDGPVSKQGPGVWRQVLMLE